MKQVWNTLWKSPLVRDLSTLPQVMSLSFSCSEQESGSMRENPEWMKLKTFLVPSLYQLSTATKQINPTLNSSIYYSIDSFDLKSGHSLPGFSGPGSHKCWPRQPESSQVTGGQEGAIRRSHFHIHSPAFQRHVLSHISPALELFPTHGFHPPESRLWKRERDRAGTQDGNYSLFVTWSWKLYPITSIFYS